MNKSIILKDSGRPGKTVAIFAGIHGNEPIGVQVLKILVQKINPIAGKIYLIYGNPKAIKKKIRYNDTDLNRSFYGLIRKNSYETKRAICLKKILNNCDALLDIHSYRYSTGKPFVICEKDSFDLVSKLDFEIITTGWDKFDVGSIDGYMRMLKKNAICLELGPTIKWKIYIPLTIQTIYNFLAYFGIVDQNLSKYSERKKVYLKIDKRMFKTEGFKFTKKFSTGEKLPKNKIFAFDEKRFYKSKNEYIFFPDDNCDLGSEVCLLGNERK